MVEVKIDKVQEEFAEKELSNDYIYIFFNYILKLKENFNNLYQYIKGIFHYNRFLVYIIFFRFYPYLIYLILLIQ